MNQPSWSEMGAYRRESDSQTVAEVVKGVTERDLNLYFADRKLSDDQILDLASILVKWGYLCIHVCPIRIKKGPIVLCRDCGRIVVEEERD